jgi:hypothetical protein
MRRGRFIRRRLFLSAVTPLLFGSVLGVSGLAGPDASSAARDLPFYYGLHTFRGEEGRTTVIAAVAVPVSELRAENRDGETRYRFDVRFVVADPAKGVVTESIDSVFLGVDRPLSRRHLLHTVIELPDAPPSSTTEQRIVVTDATRPGVGQLYLTPFPTPDYRGTDLMISDLAFGLPDTPPGWTRRGVGLALLPPSRFPERAFDIYYEIYNLPAGRPYETEIAIQRLDDDDDEHVVRTRFSGQSGADPDGTVGELRRVESALQRGRHRITVTVTDLVNERQTSTSRVVDVTGWPRGTTMVRALPKRAVSPTP